jgi:Mg-chelatase subunit ChlD/type II secretory pathway pseudopilin PulG
MNPNTPQPSREEIEAKLTALLLGELPAEEAALMRWTIAQDAGLSQLHKRLKTTIDFVREVAANPTETTTLPATPLKLSAAKREKLLAHFKLIAPRAVGPKMDAPAKRRVMPSIYALAAMVAIVALLAAISLPNFVKARATSKSNAIINNLRQLDAAKNQWALENKKPADAVATMENLKPYLLKSFPQSIAGEKYVVGKVSEPVVADVDAAQVGKVGGLVAKLSLAERDNRRLRLTSDGRVDKNGTADLSAAPQTIFYSAANIPPAPAIAPPAGTEQRLESVEAFFKNGDPTVSDGNRAQSSPQTVAAPPSAPEVAPPPSQIVLPQVNSLGLPESSKESGGGTAAFAANQSVNFYLAGTRADYQQRQTQMRAPQMSPAAGLEEATELPAAAAPQTTANIDGQSSFDLTRPISGGAGDNTSSPQIAAAQRKPAKGFVYMTAVPPHALADGGPPNPLITEAPRQPNTEEYVFSPMPAHALDSGQWVRKRDGAVVSQAEVDAWRSAQSRTVGIGGAIAGQANDTFANGPTFQQRLAYVEQPKATVSGVALATNRWNNPNGYQVQKDFNLFAADVAEKIPMLGDLPVTGDLFQKKKIPAWNQPVLGATGDTWNDTLAVNNSGQLDQSKSVGHFYRLIEGSRAGGTSQSLTVDSLGAIAQKSKVAVKDEDRPILKTPSSAPVPQPEIQTSDNAFSTFSLNVSDVSFKLAAASLENSILPEAASIRSEEFINAFDYRDPEPAVGVPVAFIAERARDPFAHNRDLLRFSIKTAAAGREPGRPLNLVLLLDNSGSMERADRVAIIHEALKVLVAQLQPQDTLSIVTFARTARLWVDGVSGARAAAAVSQVSDLVPEGGTNLEEAMKLAYATARRHYLTNGGNRVVVLTDGAANLGNVDPEALKQMVEAQRRQGIALDCFGIGWEGYNDDLLEVLSSNGDGRYAFINSPEEARTEFAAKLAGALHVAAEDVKVQVEFNPRRVTSYRQIGYATHQLTKEQFRDNTVTAAALAAREAGNALYTVEVNPQGEGPLATLHVRYKIPGTSDYREQAWDVPFTGNAPSLEQSSAAMRLAATASAFSEWLASSPYAQEVTTYQLLNYLNGVPAIYGADARPKQLETMIREAKSLSGK